MKIYNAEAQIVGRMSTKIAKDLLKGEDVIIVNTEKAVFAGSPKVKQKFYWERRERGHPKTGPFFPRTPQGIMRRAIRGMLPFHKLKGKAAFKRLKVCIGIPDKYKDKEYIQVKDANAEKLRCKHITVEKLSLSLGAKKKW